MITTVILDFGHVLARPLTGNWFLPPNAVKIVPADFLKTLIENKVETQKVINQALLPLDDNHLVKTEEEEFAQFKGFYAEILPALGYEGDLTAASDALARDLVFNNDKFVFFDDVESTLHKIKETYRLGLLSDTWPSLKRVFINKGLFELFDSFTMSCDYGITKERTRLFEIALEELEVNAGEAVFVDDSEGNLMNAEKVGLLPVLMNRYPEKVKSRYRVISGLWELFDMIEGL